MSFKCDFCKKTSPKGGKLHMIPTELREKAYPEGTMGQEIAKEAKMCEECWKEGN